MPEVLNRHAIDRWSNLSVLLTDFDDTLTQNGRLPANCIAALERLEQQGLAVIIVTGRSAGWCDMMARVLPVFGVVGENGAFFFRYNAASKRCERFYYCSEYERKTNTDKLSDLKDKIFRIHPNLTLASDQNYRMFDLAIDISEDCFPLDSNTITNIFDLCQEHGATAKLSSIHMNIWFGNYTKATMSHILLKQYFFAGEGEYDYTKIGFIGDSPNDEAMFEKFKLTIGVANISHFLKNMSSQPRWIATHRGSEGFVEFANYLLIAKSRNA